MEGRIHIGIWLVFGVILEYRRQGIVDRVLIKRETEKRMYTWKRVHWDGDCSYFMK